jgi:Phage derived protein Gp49-like (DUF891)
LARVEVFYYREDEHTVPLIQWLDDIPGKAQQKCLVRLQRLEELGYELRRPEGDYLRDEIYELRASHQGGSLSDALLRSWPGCSSGLPRHRQRKRRAAARNRPRGEEEEGIPRGSG